MDDFERTPNQIRWVPQTDRLDHEIYGSWTVSIKSEDSDLIAAFNLVILPACETESSLLAYFNVMEAREDIIVPLMSQTATFSPL